MATEKNNFTARPCDNPTAKTSAACSGGETSGETPEIVRKRPVIYPVIKRCLDFLFSLLLLLPLLPVFLLIAILIKIDSAGPVFYKQKRIGKGDKPFYIYKFRSMCANADALLKDLDPEKKAEYETNYKLQDDFRITRVGRFIRKTNLDELPQLINILLGQMSFIGPRPVVPKEIEKYGDRKDLFLSVSPGLTGYWQANRKADTSYEERIEMELYYVFHQSFPLDVRIFFQTFSIAFSQPEGK